MHRDRIQRVKLVQKLCPRCAQSPSPQERSPQPNSEQSQTAASELSVSSASPLQAYNHSLRVKRYAGVQQPKDVEAELTPNEFMLYHKLPHSDNAEPPSELPLMIAYRTSFGDNHHYKVRCVEEPETNNVNGLERRDTCYYVETGPEQPPCFSTLSGLVRHYELYNYLVGPTAVETFPWWQLDKDEGSTNRPYKPKKA